MKTELTDDEVTRLLARAERAESAAPEAEPCPYSRGRCACGGRVPAIAATERAVLDASAKAPDSELRLVVSMPGHPTWEVEHARAELARRYVARGTEKEGCSVGSVA